MKRVYISSPYSQGSTTYNVRLAIDAADILLLAGFAPFVPHLSWGWDIIYPHPWEMWLDWCVAWVPACDCLLRIPGISRGADIEVALARELGIPVYGTINELIEKEG